ncbi:MAG: helix-turn-helix transcriptional regulator [Flavobacterium sp. 38-13]|uniref:LuxR C-terminal-related transcriptional regulator n=1 Tax=Flavobacterium sp. 38-13 TaxID=1896168 RepID=UPI000967C3E9|nr:LuxR C-terminal-related transcriptional regulator [Flavobacterium sp. 38-13]OJX54824.1 MAG: helix-turn-helix transcriptional regulator [Flavobacterium sp. 38-13]
MKPIRHVLNKVWEKYPQAMENKHKEVNVPINIGALVSEMFAVGEFYYYVINITDSTISNFHSNILSIHGLSAFPKHLSEIIALIHPDDVSFVIDAENWTLVKLAEIGFEHQLNIKSGYCFRMKTADGTYRLFHHQAIHTAKDENGKLVQSANIHTDISHLSSQNNHIVTLSGIGGRSDFYQIQLSADPCFTYPSPNLTRREIEILKFLGQGYTCKEIASHLFLSYHTVRSHHKNILKKTECNNTAGLIKKAIEYGYL